MKGCAIHQFAPQVCSFDAVGNEVFAIRGLLRRQGLRSEIFCATTDERARRDTATWHRSGASHQDLILVHYSHGSQVFDELFEEGTRRILVYHNITPSQYFKGTNRQMEEASSLGKRQLPLYSDKVDLAFAHSWFSARDLAASGFQRVEILPYILNEELYEVTPDAALLRQCREDGWVNVLTVGRIAPNKCLEDCLLAFDCFKRTREKKSRLFVVGHSRGTEAYFFRLQRLVEKLNLRDVIFTGAVSQEALAAYYRAADVFISMSEHEGFGVALIEAMRYDVPVVAYASTAIPETTRGAGVLVKEKSWQMIGEVIGFLALDEMWRKRVLTAQRAVVSYYSAEAARQRFSSFLQNLQ